MPAEPRLRDIDLMLATNYRPFSREGWIFEFKYDGSPDSVVIASR